MLWIGGTSLLVGWALAFLPVIEVLKPSFVLAFFAFGLLLIGTVVGFYGVYTAFRTNHRV